MSNHTRRPARLPPQAAGPALRSSGSAPADHIHPLAEAMRRAFADRARYVGDPDFVKDMPLKHLVSKEYAAGLRKTIRPNWASVSSASSFEWTEGGTETTPVSVVDLDRNSVALTTTLEDDYGPQNVGPRAGGLT